MISYPLVEHECLKEGAGPPPEAAHDEKIALHSPDSAGLHCIACDRLITFTDRKTVIHGGFEHSFVNPLGLLFVIGCFASAPGAAVSGPASSEFTWFPGYSWSPVNCAGCGLHLGWRFIGGDGIFFGLILERLIFRAAQNP